MAKKVDWKIGGQEDWWCKAGCTGTGDRYEIFKVHEIAKIRIWEVLQVKIIPDGDQDGESQAVPGAVKVRSS